MRSLADLLTIALGVLLGSAAVLKVAFRTDLVQPLVELGVPPGLLAGHRSRAVLPAVVGAEALVVGGLLVPVAASIAAGVAAVGLTVAALLFTRSVLTGRAVHCSCFGRAATRSADLREVARNAAAAVAAVALATGVADRSGESPTRTWAVGGVAVIGIQFVALVVLSRKGRQSEALGESGTLGLVTAESPTAGVSRRTPGLDVTWMLRLVGGGAIRVAAALDRDETTLLFIDPVCAPCLAVIGRLREGFERRDWLNMLIVSRGDDATNIRLSEQLPHPLFVVQRDFELATALGVTGTPSAVILNRGGSVAGSVAVGAVAVSALLDRQLELAMVGGVWPRP